MELKEEINDGLYSLKKNMMMKMNKYLACLFIVAAGLCVASCTKEDDFKKFIAGGEVTYPARVDSVIVKSGNKRVQLRLALGSDPSITRIKAYWNNRADSLEMPVTRTGGYARDTINMLISNLNEGVYNFDVYTFNADNNISVVAHATGSVYGDSYASTIANRLVKSITQDVAGNVVITWLSPLAGEQFIEIKYRNNTGAEKTIKTPKGALSTSIADYQGETVLSYRSVFLPDSNAYDTFSKDYVNITLPAYERQLAKGGFAEVILPTDVKEGGFGWLMPALWNGVYTGNGFATQPNKPLPVWFTFDTGVLNKLSKVRFWMPQDRIYRLEAVKSFEVWGSENPAPDGSWDSWTLLRTCEVPKPSGSPVGTNTAADIAAAEAGHDFVLPTTVPRTRYIRIKVLSNWGNGSFQAMGEFTFFTKERL